jgi:putative oxidoreductase
MVLQRTFSSFANGWPGVGLFVQRLVTTTLLIHCLIEHFPKTFALGLIAPHFLGVTAGIGLLLGLWTPIMGALIAVVQISIVISRVSDPWIALTIAALSITLAMIGPGAWSIDARLFGRKLIRIPMN